MTEILGWETEEVQLKDEGLKSYINLSGRVVMHTHGKHASKQFAKSDVSIIERLVNSIMRSGSKKKVGGHRITARKGCGKKNMAHKSVEDALELINKKTKENPLQVLVTAIENSAPKEETTRVKYGGITKHIAVDISPQRRVDFALRNIAVASLAKAYKSKKDRAEALADEIIAAAKNDSNSMAISKKNEVERVARGAR
jgi:small subunit ribosomal protein S7